eukprot:2884388-Pyramimonas_sp.AAC.1
MPLNVSRRPSLLTNHTARGSCQVPPPCQPSILGGDCSRGHLRLSRVPPRVSLVSPGLGEPG